MKFTPQSKFLLVATLFLSVSDVFATGAATEAFEARHVVIQTFFVGELPVDLTFDGANIWTANGRDNTVYKLRASDGVLQGVFTTGDFPEGLTFDGANIWVANFGANTVTKLRASDGQLQGTFPVGSGPQGMAFDGANIWVTNSLADTVSKLRASDGALQGAAGCRLSGNLGCGLK